MAAPLPSYLSSHRHACGAMKRYVLYVVLALTFGVIEWFTPFMRFLPPISNWFIAQGIAVTVWLVPVAAIAWVEAATGGAFLLVYRAVIGFWLIALIGYYFSYALSAFVLSNDPLLSSLHVGTGKWISNEWRFFYAAILPELVQWSIVALVSGIFVSAAVVLVHNDH